MKQKASKFAPFILLGLIFILLIVLNIFYHDHWLDSDMAAEMMFSKLLSEENHVFATTDWYYSTEFRFLYTQLLMAPLFKIISSWHVIRAITNIVFYLLIVVSYFYFVKPLKISNGHAAIGASILLLPFSETMATHMQMGNTYLSHVIIIFFAFGMYLRLVNYKLSKSRWLAVNVFFILISFICGVSGVRYLLVLQCPLALAAIIYLLKSDEFGEIRKSNNFADKNIWKKLLKCHSAKYLYYAVWGAFISVLGYGLNVVWVSKKYVFQTYGATNFISIVDGILFERIQNAFGCLLMLFGYIPDKGFLSARGIISMISFALVVIFIICIVASLKKEKSDRAFLTYFVVISFIVNVFVFVFTTSTMVPRYYLTIFMFVVVITTVYLEGEHYRFDKIIISCLLCACLTLATAKTVYSFITVDKNESKRAVAAFLDDNDYNFGFATYNNGNIITELTNGNVEIANIWDPENMSIFTWSSPAKYYEKDYHQGETFLLLTIEEANAYKEATVVKKGEKIYDDGEYVVLIYEDTAKLFE